MEKKVVILKDDQCFEVTEVSTGNQYNDKSKFFKEGKTYGQYKFNGVVFNVKEELGFGEALKKGDLATVKLVETSWLKKVKRGDEEVDVPTLGYEFDTFVTETSLMARNLRKVKHSAQLDAISRVASSEAMTPEMLGVLMGATI